MPTETEGVSQTTPDPKTVEAPQPDIGNLVNSAVTNQLKRFAEKQLPSLFAEAMKPFQEQIAALKSVPEPEDKKKVIAPEVVALTQQLEEMKAKLTREAEQRATSEKKAREDRAFNDFKGHLSKSVRPEMLDMVASHLFHIKKLVEVGEDGTAVFKGTRTQLGMTEEVQYPLKDGVDNYLKSEDAKPYLPAPGVSTTPTSKRPTVMPSTMPKDFDLSKATPQQKLQAAEELEKTYAAALAARAAKF